MNVKIEKLDYEGRGLTHIDGCVCFVPRVLKGEEGDIKIIREEKHFKVGQMKKLNKKSSKRLFSYCPYASYCGGCTYDFVSYADSLTFKKEILIDLFQQKKIKIPAFEIVASRPVLGYRNKVFLQVQNGLFGYFKEESHDFVPIETCYLLKDAIRKVLNDFSFYHFSNGTLMVRCNEKDELLLSVHTTESPLISEELVHHHKIIGILWNDKLVYGKDYLEEERKNVVYQIKRESFFQVNPYISQKILEDVLSFFSSSEVVMDLYCGCGFFSFPLAYKVKEVIGVEVCENSILGAVKQVERNNLSNISFHVGKVEEILPKISMSKSVLVDPPRSGLKKNVIEAFIQKKIKKICYISCNPLTLARDLNYLSPYYEMTFFKAYDMFAFTSHVECVCLLNRR